MYIHALYKDIYVYLHVKMLCLWSLQIIISTMKDNLIYCNKNVIKIYKTPMMKIMKINVISAYHITPKIGACSYIRHFNDF